MESGKSVQVCELHVLMAKQLVFKMCISFTLWLPIGRGGTSNFSRQMPRTNIMTIYSNLFKHGITHAPQHHQLNTSHNGKPVFINKTMTTGHEKNDGAVHTGRVLKRMENYVICVVSHFRCRGQVKDII